MKNNYILYFLLLFVSVLFPQEDMVVSSADNNKIVFTSSNLPIVVINTNGQQIIDDVKITADMGIIYNGEGVRNNINDPFNNYNGKIGIEIRGSSSQQFPKKQYAVETRDLSGNDLKVSLLGFPEESDWILFAPYNDKSLMRDVLVYKLANEMGRYASRSKFCEVILNGDYVGVYVLLEKVKRDSKRVNIKKLEPTDVSADAITGGYIIKIDKTDGESVDGWYSNYLPYPQSPYSVFYQYHVPKPEDIVQQQKEYIKGKIFQFETIMKGNNISDSLNGYPRIIDVDSFVDFVLLNEISKNVDGYRLSTYFYKDRDSRNPKIYAGPVWDFNLGFGNADYYEGWQTNEWQLEYLTDYESLPPWESFLAPNWWKKLFDDTLFGNKVYSRWKSLKDNVLSSQHINNQIDSLVILLDESKTRNFERWSVLGVWVWPNYYVGSTFQDEINYLKNWIKNRISWMDQNMIGEPTSINDIDNLAQLDFVLEQNYPNPFNPSTKIRYSIPALVETHRDASLQMVTIKVYNILGGEVATLVNEQKTSGNYEVEFSAAQLSTGIYLYRLQAGDFTISRKMILLK